MNRLADYTVRTIAMAAAAGITVLTLFIHATDRTGAPAANPDTIMAQSQDSRPSTNDQAAPAAVALAAHDQC
jgi:hypothetical protein